MRLPTRLSTTCLAGFVTLAVSSTVSMASVGTTLAGGGLQLTPRNNSLDTSRGPVTITTTAPRTILNWDSFSVGKGESVHFAQPSSGSAVLNRVTGFTPSTIDGTLSSNGSVYLVNPNGIAISSSGVINTAGFIASTLDVADDAFLTGGELYLSGDSTASVTNAGTITVTGGNVFLIAQQVVNTGAVTAPDGTVGLAAGSEVLLFETSEEGSEHLYVLAGEGAVANQGLITAASAELKAAGGNTFALAINNEGVIRATTLTEEGGRIILRADSGTLANTGELTASGTAETSGYVELAAFDIQNTGIVTAGQLFTDSYIYLEDIYTTTSPDEEEGGDGEIIEEYPVIVVVDDSTGNEGIDDPIIHYTSVPGERPVGYNYRNLTGDFSSFNQGQNVARPAQLAFAERARFQSSLIATPAGARPETSTVSGSSSSEERELPERAL